MAVTEHKLINTYSHTLEQNKTTKKKSLAIMQLHIFLIQQASEKFQYHLLILQMIMN